MKSIQPMGHYNVSDFLRGHASQIITKVMVIIISYDRYERLLKEGIDIKEY